VLRFHIDYYKGEGNQTHKHGDLITKQAVVDAILDKHDSATNSRKFNAIFATASINDAIEYYKLFRKIQRSKQQKNEDFKPLNIACVFSPPAQLMEKENDLNSLKNSADIKQLQEDLIQEKEDNQQNPEEKKETLIQIINDYNRQFGTNHNINEFDLYYQDVQNRIKLQKYSNKEYSNQNKIDITIVVDMLLTGFDSKYLNTLYVDKNLKYHGLIQAFSRTNRVLNDTKPYGNILDFRSQQDAVNQAIALFSGKNSEQAKEIWLVEPASVVIEKYREAVKKLEVFMTEQNLVNEPQEVYNLKGDAARIAFVKNFKEIQKLKTQLNQYTDLEEEQKKVIETILPTETLHGFRSSYLETAKQLKMIQDKQGDDAPIEIQELDFEFILFASSVIDYDYIMDLISDSTQQKTTKQKMSKEQVKNLLKSTSNLMDEEQDLSDFIDNLDWTKGYGKEELTQLFDAFKNQKYNKELAEIANKHGLTTVTLKTFVENILARMIFDGEKLTDLLIPLELSWKERSQRELSLMEDLIPQLKKLAQGAEISGLEAYE
jgi:type I restriction-modification system restriction subunit